MTAPDRICIYPMAISAGEPQWLEGGEWWPSNGRTPPGEDYYFAVEFVRADLSAAAVAQARREALEAAAKACDTEAGHISIKQRNAFIQGHDREGYRLAAAQTTALGLAFAIRALKDK